MTSTLVIGKELVDLCKNGKNIEAIETLYSKDIVSVEAASDGKMPREMKGIDAILGKSKWWLDNHTVHSAKIEGPYTHGDDKFACFFSYDVTPKATGQRFTMDEVAVYTVNNGKIAREEFYYSMEG